MNLYDTLVAGLKALGVFDFLIPFLLIWAIVYGVLIRSKIFGDAFDSSNQEHARMVRSLSSLIATAIALLVVGTAYVVGLIQTVVPWVAFGILILVSAVMVGSVMSLTGTEVSNVFPNWFKIVVAIVAFLTIVGSIIWYVFFRNVQGPSINFGSVLQQYIELIASVVIFVILLAFVYFMVREPEEGKKEEKEENAS